MCGNVPVVHVISLGNHINLIVPKCAYILYIYNFTLLNAIDFTHEEESLRANNSDIIPSTKTCQPYLFIKHPASHL